MADKKLTIEIAEADQEALRNSEYLLCIAKQVVGYQFDVIWQASSQYLANNTFSWTEDFGLFASRSFTPGQQVEMSVGPVPIALGQQSTLDSSGVLSPAQAGGVEGAITMINQFGTINPGLTQSATAIDGSATNDANFLTSLPVLKGETVLTPSEQILVWFQQSVSTGTMVNRLPPVQGSRAQRPTSTTFGVVVDFSSTNSRTVLYQSQQWVVTQ